MSIIRTKRSVNFTLIPNEIVNDANLRGDVLGLLVYLLSKPPDWRITIESLSALKRFGSKNTVNAALKALRSTGYADLKKRKDGTTAWTIYDTKHQPESHIPKSGICPDPKKPDPKKPDPKIWDALQNKDFYKELIEEQRTVDCDPRAREKSEFSLPDWLNPKTWNSFVEHRKAMKAPLTPHAVKLAISKLAELRADGNDPDHVIAQSILNGWKGLFEHKSSKRNGSVHETNSRPDNSAIGKVRRAIAERDAREAAERLRAGGQVSDYDCIELKSADWSTTH